MRRKYYYTSTRQTEVKFIAIIWPKRVLKLQEILNVKAVHFVLILLAFCLT